MELSQGPEVQNIASEIQDFLRHNSGIILNCNYEKLANMCYYTVQNDMDELLGQLLQIKDMTNEMINQDTYLLHTAVQYNANRCIEVLLHNQADLSNVNSQGQNVLHIAALSNNITIYRRIRQYAPGLELQFDENGLTPDQYFNLFSQVDYDEHSLVNSNNIMKQLENELNYLCVSSYGKQTCCEHNQLQKMYKLLQDTVKLYYQLVETQCTTNSGVMQNSNKEEFNSIKQFLNLGLQILDTGCAQMELQQSQLNQQDGLLNTQVKNEQNLLANYEIQLSQLQNHINQIEKPLHSLQVKLYQLKKQNQMFQQREQMFMNRHTDSNKQSEKQSQVCDNFIQIRGDSPIFKLLDISQQNSPNIIVPVIQQQNQHDKSAKLLEYEMVNKIEQLKSYKLKSEEYSEALTKKTKELQLLHQNILNTQQCNNDLRNENERINQQLRLLGSGIVHTPQIHSDRQESEGLLNAGESLNGLKEETIFTKKNQESDSSLSLGRSECQYGLKSETLDKPISVPESSISDIPSELEKENRIDERSNRNEYVEKRVRFYNHPGILLENTTPITLQLANSHASKQTYYNLLKLLIITAIIVTFWTGVTLNPYC